MKKNNALSKILTIVMVIECILIVITFLMLCQEFEYGEHWYYDEDSFVYDIQDETYGDMVSRYYENYLGGCPETRGLRECYGVARYYEAAFWKNAYDMVGDTERSTCYGEKMAEAYEEMGDYQFLDANIREKLNMN